MMLGYIDFVRLYGTGDAAIDDDNYEEYVQEQGVYTGFYFDDDDDDDTEDDE